MPSILSEIREHVEALFKEKELKRKFPANNDIDPCTSKNL